MAIETQLRPETNLGGLPMFGLPPPLPHQDYHGGCGFGYNVHSMGNNRKRQRFDGQELMYMQQQQNLCSVSGFQDGVSEIDRKTRNFPVGLDWQNDEIDQYIRLQSEKLRWLLKEQRRQQESMLLRKIESRAQSLIQQKDEEIARATKRAAELQTLLMKVEAESQAWQRLSQENEAMVVSLTNALEQVRGRGEEEDAESCCDNGAEEARTGESRGAVVACRGGCSYGEACVLFLPCRHLCSCKSCDGFLQRCPVCGTAKKATVEALFQ